MALHSTPAIVLRSINLSENDKLITFMTEYFGKVKCVAKSARKLKNRFGAALESMSHINLIFFGRQNQTLYNLNHSDIIHSFQSVRENFRKVFMGIYFTEAVEAMASEGHREAGLFYLLLDSLKALKEQEELETLCRLFEIRLLCLAGYTPQLDHCVVCKSEPNTEWIGFSYHRNSIVCEACAKRNKLETRFKSGILQYLKKMITMDIKLSERLKFPRGADKEIERIIHRMILSHTRRELKSYPFIHKMNQFQIDYEKTSC